MHPMLNRTVILTLALLLPTIVSAQAQVSAEEYLRIERDETGSALSLQTPIVGFDRAAAGQEPLRVDLVGAIHVGDASYYAALNERFEDYDAVLYELVAPEGAVPQPNAAPGNLVSGMQFGLTRLLELTFQLDGVDYAAQNFVHADLTPEALAQSMRNRGESMLTYMVRLFTAAMEDPSLQASAAPVGPGVIAALFSPDRPRLLKIIMASAMLDVTTFTSIIEGDSGSSLVADRNARAIEVLQNRIEAGDRNIAIFYGVAHLPDFAERLESEIGLTRSEIDWIDAWDLRAKPEN